jgi:hypothetical protein
MDTTGEKEKRTYKKNVDRRSSSSHDNKKFGTRSVEKRRGMAFGFRKKATAVIKPDGWIEIRLVICPKFLRKRKYLLLSSLYVSFCLMWFVEMTVLYMHQFESCRKEVKFVAVLMLYMVNYL